MTKRLLLAVTLLAAASLACSTLLGPDVEPGNLLPDVIEPGGGDAGGGDPGGGEPAGGEPAGGEPAGGEPAGGEPSGGGASSDVLLEDDFSDSGTGWEIGEFSGGSVGYRGGQYFVQALGNGDTMWGVAFRDFQDVVIEVSAEQVSAPANDNNDYGVMCRVQPNGDGYFLLISGDGFYTILKASNESFSPLIDWTQSNVINQGNATNSVVGTCEGSNLSLEVNGQLLGATSDSEFSHGDIALTATSYEDESTEVLFDNIVVTRP